MEKNQLRTIASILLAFAMIIVSLTPTFAIEANDVTESPSKGLTVTATSNLFPEKKVTLSPNQKTIKVTYVLQTQSKDMLDFQWSMHYDSSVLKPTENSNKTTSFEYSDISAGLYSSYSYNKSNQGVIRGNGSNLKLYDTSSKEIVFASAEFNIIDPSATETTVYLDVQVLSLSKVDPDTEITITGEEVEIINFGLNQANYDMFVTVCKTDSAPVSSEETTVAPTTEESTEAPTTEEATTAPTTEPAPAADPIYVVAGSEEFTGLEWIGDPVGGAQNVMTKDGDLYTKTFTAAPAGKNYQVRVVKNVANGTNPGTGETVWDQGWIGTGEQYDVNFTFDVTDTCDVTVTFNPATNEINVTGDSVKVVTALEIEYITAVGNGLEGWLNGENWKIDADSNKLEMFSDRVYKITYKGVTSSDYYVFKFAANGSWAANWGLPAEENGAPVGENYALTYNGENMVLDTVALGYEEGTLLDVTLTLDLSDFDYSTKLGAKANIKVVPNDDHEHEYDVTIKTNATCTKEGLQEKKCKVCGYKYSESISPLGHNYKVTVIKPTCTEKGYMLHTCLRCGDTYKDNYALALDHVYGEWLVKLDPTCNSNGIKYRVCDVCSHEELAEIPATGHNYNSNIIKPTCTEKGYTVYNCSKCGDTYKDNFVKALGHVYDEWRVKSKPGCTSKGLKYRVCSVCSNEETAEIPAIGHIYDNNIIEPTCTEKGYTKHTCSACGDSYKDSYIDAKGHSYGKWIVDEAATVLSKGSKHRVCTECRHTETQTIAQVIVDINTDKNYGRANFTVVNAQTLEPIKNACIFISTEKDGENTFSTDSNGKVSIVLPVGKQTISVYADGCITRNTKITVKSGINDIPKIGLSEKPTYDAKITSKPMTIEEIKEAGIDTSTPENQHVYKYELKLDFDPEIDTSSIISYFNSEGDYLGGYYAGNSTGSGGSGGGTAEPSDPTYNLHYHVVTGGIWHSWCKSIEVEKGQNVSLTYHPYRDDENYVFDGWYEDDSFTKKIYSTHIKDYSTYVYGRWIYVGEGEEQKISTNPGITIPTKDEVITVYPVSEHFYLIVRGEVKWLKEMFDVEMLVVNNSNTDTLENLTASLTLPKGLSLADMNGEQQTLDKKIDNIPEGKSESVHWYVRGDVAGSYSLEARLKGKIMPFEEDIDDTFVSENQLQVWPGNALNLHFDFPNAAYYGEDYPITITLSNVSDKTLYNINHIVQIEQGMEIYYSDGSKKEKIEKSSWKSIGVREFNPGDKIIIQTSTNIFFKSEIIENKLESLVGIVDGVEQLINAYKAIKTAVDATESLVNCVSGCSKALDNFDFTIATESTEKLKLFKTLHQKVSGLMLSYSTSGNKTIDASVKLANTGINTSLNAITDNPDEWLKNNSVDDVKSLLTKIDALENSISESGATSRKFDIYDSIRTAISAIPIRFTLSNVIMTEDDNNTTSIPWSYSVSQSSAQYFGVSSVSKYLTSITKATMGEIYDESMPWYLQLIPGLDDPFNQDEAIGYIKATENEIAQFKAKDATGDVTFKAWVECNESIQNISTFASVPLNSASNFVLSSDNKSATVGINGVLTFKGDGMISVKPLSQTGGTLYIEDSEGNLYTYVIDVVAQHECTAGERETVIAPTKDYDGFAVKCCKVCGEIMEIDNLQFENICRNHTYGEWKTETSSTCTQSGIDTRSCSVCGKIEYEFTDKKEHSCNDWKITKAATCQDQGEKQSVCTECGETITRSIEKIPHTGGNWEVVKEATAFEEGLKKLHCKNCDEIIQSSIIPMTKETFGYSKDSQDRILMGIPECITPEMLIKHYDNMGLAVRISDSEGNLPEYVGTGCRVFFDNAEYSVVLKGDTSGDGVIDIFDYYEILDYLNGKGTLTGNYYKASLITSDEPSIFDAYAIIDYINDCGALEQ